MEVFTIIALLLVGGIIGFFASRFLSPSTTQTKKLALQVSESETALAQYKLDVAEHLDSSASLLAQMNETCQKAMKQMEESTKLLQQATPNDIDVMPFFSKETQEQLAQTVSLRHEKKDHTPSVDTQEPPLDYSGEATGLFADKKQTVTNADLGN
ncbi:YhcB family protein [Thalassotalea piscium]